jgi:hypothetical protein
MCRLLKRERDSHSCIDAFASISEQPIDREPRSRSYPTLLTRQLKSSLSKKHYELDGNPGVVMYVDTRLTEYWGHR